MEEKTRKILRKINTKNRQKTEKCNIHTPSLLITAIILCLLFVNAVHGESAKDIVEEWAKTFGDELYFMARNMTKVNEIKDKYKQFSTQVVQKGDLIKAAVENVGRMFQRKVDAVRCIADKAEKLAADFVFNETDAENFQYYSSKYSTINNVSCAERSETKEQCSEFEIVKNATKTLYLNMTLNRDKHFYHINVNTDHTSVHVPTNVYDEGRDPMEALMWSQNLDDVFVNNYDADPALSWQYFGSETGILRHYPAKSWEDRDTSSSVDVYDCRKRSWYIETATCSKDVVILLDRTGSMYKYLSFLAKLTIKNLLDTFSNNDSFNIYTYSEDVTPLVECFVDELVPATPENIKVFNEKLVDLTVYNYANETHIKNAIIIALNLLKKVRIERRCGPKVPCNQAIMLITDNIQGNFTQTFLDHNRDPDKPERIPVRVFTYLLGKDQSNVEEMKSIACMNRGTFAHIQTLDEVQEKVLDYVSKIALPLVLQGTEHPPTWTHAFKDATYRDEETYVQEKGDKQPLSPRLMIAVGVPAFKISEIKNGTDNSKNYTGLLGVASTDVPVEDIDKLTLPYKLGVNAYPFIVSNNGYVLLHPELRPIEYSKLPKGTQLKDDDPGNDNRTEIVYLKENYNSIDFTEVEQINEYVPENETYTSRPEIGPILAELRRLALNMTEEKKLGVPVHFLYDKMRRVSEELYDYYFAPLNSTPFTLGLAIPSTYGQQMIRVGDEIQSNIRAKMNMLDLFRGDNWKVHPDWVYCRFHYLEYKSFDNSQEELLYFLKSFYNETWRWYEQYAAGNPEDEKNANDEKNVNNPNCNRTTLEKSGYYCNRELVQLLIFDAKITNASYGTYEFESKAAANLIKSYNASLRFVATGSGLTRWQFIFGEPEGDQKEFGDYYTKAIDETWYKSAVLQHSNSNNSGEIFVYSVPHDDKDDVKEEGDIKVMASHAIFREDGLLKAPGCVVGFQFLQKNMTNRFLDITGKSKNQSLLKPCTDYEKSCYVIDNNGYIIVSENSSDTGRFFGDVEWRAMLELVELQIYKNITVYDYQAVCIKENEEDEGGQTSCASLFITPFTILKYSLQWLVTELALSLARIQWWADGDPLADMNDDRTVTSYEDDQFINTTMSNNTEEVGTKKDKKLIEFEPCDKKATLYVMERKESGTTTFMIFAPIPNSNLLLIVIDNSTQREEGKLDAEAKKIEYKNFSFPCHKKYLNNLDRRAIEECFVESDREYENVKCNQGAMPNKIDHILLLLTLILPIFIIIQYFSRVHYY